MQRHLNEHSEVLEAISKHKETLRLKDLFATLVSGGQREVLQEKLRNRIGNLMTVHKKHREQYE